MTYKVVRMPLYALIVIVAVGIVSPILGTVAAVQITERGTARQLELAAQQAADIREEQRLRACSVYGALIKELEENPPQGNAGQALLGEYRRQYKIRTCAR